MSTPPTPDLPARDFRYELAGAFIDSGCTEFVSRKMADEFLAAHAAAVRTAALTEAADAVLLDTAHIRYGSATDYAERHATLLRRLAVAPTATPTPEEH